MKNLIRILSLFICCATLLLTFTACQDEPQYERIMLTKDNYEQYLSVNSYITDVTCEEYVQFGETYYNLAYVQHIETSKKIDCTFENVSITFTGAGIVSNSHHTNMRPQTLDYNGNSHFSMMWIDEKYAFLPGLLGMLPPLYAVGTIEGYVIVNKTPKNIINQ